MIFCCFLSLLLSHSLVCFAQIEGFVSDAKDSERIPFVHIINLNTSNGVLSDINGFFRIEAQQGDILQFSYVGYANQKITVTDSTQINVELTSNSFSLSDLEIRPGINPAHRIINNAIANREKNNPDNRDGYTCMIYTKIIVDVTERPLHFFPEEGTEDTHLLINETVISRQYRFKDNSREQIIASRTSGFEDFQQLSFFSASLQPFHFYHDVLEWKAPTKHFLNPISPGSTSRYFFLLRDTIVSGIDSMFIISYQPRRATNFEGLKGLLYINSDGWAIQNVVAEPADYSPVNLKIQHSYANIDSVWFPAEHSLQLFLENVSGTGLNFIFRAKSHIEDVNLMPHLTDVSFRGRNLTIADNANRQTEIIDLYRNTELNPKENASFKQYRSGALDFMFRITEGFVDNTAISVKKVDFPLKNIIDQNYSEGFRTGLGIYTNRHLSPWFSLGGYFGYGISDKRKKYGASLSLYPEKHLDSEIKLWWANDLYSLTLSNEAGISARKLWDRFEIETQFIVRDFQAAFDYSFIGSEMTNVWNRNAEAGFRLRYAHNEERAKLYRRSIPLFTTRYPVLHLNVSFGFPNKHIRSVYKYIKIEAAAEQSKHIRNLGTTTVSLKGGWMNDNVPFPLIYNVTATEQSLFLTGTSNWRTSFNVLTGNFYAANQYFNTFLYHDFGTLLGKTNSKIFRPRIAIAQSFGWSKLNRPEEHVSAKFIISDMRNGYFENGIVIEDIIRIELMNIFFLRFGCGVYGAYGGSIQKPFEKTITPKIRIAASF